MSYIPERFPRYKDYALPPFPPLKGNISGHLDKIKDFESRDSDIFICTFPKSGTNWINEIVSMISKGRSEYSEVYKNTAMLEALPSFGALHDVPESTTRIINSHLPFADLPSKHIQNGYKVVHFLRNPKDVAVSFYNHLTNIKDFTTMQAPKDYPASWPLYIEHYCRGEEFYGGWFNYEKGFEKAKETGELSNVFTAHYEQLKQDPLPVLRALANFLGVKATDELLEDINERCSFDKMSTVGASEKDDSVIKAMSVTGKNFIFRKGQVGDWKNWFTVAQNEAFDRLIETNMKDSKLKFRYEYIVKD
ncbi:sulfotransferase 1B1-like [Ylistrum balloti]|uniref:sulfotransferase 1B1-like n=1 Tax=Ylistrum balloti TaxID=509963 RepID=UPI0029057F8D|nr:sulfotransferase 1B1-like [Ylistrum balloti]